MSGAARRVQARGGAARAILPCGTVRTEILTKLLDGLALCRKRDSHQFGESTGDAVRWHAVPCMRHARDALPP